MAGYREHIAVSSTLGVAVGAAATFGLGFTPAQGALAGYLTSFGGMLPDLDSESGKPIRELFSLLGAVVPMLTMGHVFNAFQIESTPESIMLTFIILYHVVRYGGAWLIGKLAVHRGMFHSIPALLISSFAVYLTSASSLPSVKMLLASGIGIGFLSHLVLDEMYSVEWTGVRIKLNRFAGSAIKFVGKSTPANIVTYGLLITMTYAVLVDAEILKSDMQNAPKLLPHATNEMEKEIELPEVILR